MCTLYIGNGILNFIYFRVTMATSTTTLEGRDIIKEGWLTVYKSRNPTFLTKQKVCYNSS